MSEFLAFYKSIGFTSPEEDEWRAGRYPIFSLAFGNNKINVHPEGFIANLRGPTAVPVAATSASCGKAASRRCSRCWPKPGSRSSKGRSIASAAATRAPPTSVSVYVRDPDDNLVEFMCYGEPAVGEQYERRASRRKHLAHLAPRQRVDAVERHRHLVGHEVLAAQLL